MFFRDRSEMLDLLGRMGASVCSYCIGDPTDWLATRCDCKYGAEAFGTSFMERSGSEQTGCPELRSVYMVIATMTDAEWDDLLHRGGGVTTTELRRALENQGFGVDDA